MQNEKRRNVSVNWMVGSKYNSIMNEETNLRSKILMGLTKSRSTDTRMRQQKDLRVPRCENV